MIREEERTLTIKGEKKIIKKRILPVAKEKKEIKKDCFAFSQGKCSALNELYCKNKECRFYKSKQQYSEELKLNEKRKMGEN